jgi:hypothetical protein
MAVYLYHFNRAYRTETGREIRHYAGYTSKTEPKHRFNQHIKGYGSPLVAAVCMAGIKVRIVRIWPDEGPEFEQKLKAAHNLRRFCPTCYPRLLREQRRKYQVKKRGKQTKVMKTTRKPVFTPDVVGPTPQALAKADRERRLEEAREEKRRRHPCEACESGVTPKWCFNGHTEWYFSGNAIWPSRVCKRCHSRLETVRQYAAEDPDRDLDLLERFIRNQFACPLDLVVELLEKETRDENQPFS